MVHRYSTALSHLILAGTGAYCWTAHGVTSFVRGVFSIIVGNSLIGVWRWGNPGYGDKVGGIYEATTIAQTLFALSLACTQLWLGTSHRKELAYAHAAAAALSMLLYLSGKRRTDLVDLVVGVNIFSMAMMGILQENYYAVASAISFTFNHFLLSGNVIDAEDLPIIDIYNYGLCFFSYFVLRTF